MTKKPEPSRIPHHCRRSPSHPLDAWWYEDRSGIEIYISDGSNPTFHCRIPWSTLIVAAKRCGVNP